MAMFLSENHINSGICDCDICFSTFGESESNKPKILNCGHSFCNACLKELLQYSRIKCPKCNAITNVQRGRNLSTNFDLLNLINDLNDRVRSQPKMQLLNLIDDRRNQLRKLEEMAENSLAELALVESSDEKSKIDRALKYMQKHDLDQLNAYMLRKKIEKEKLEKCMSKLKENNTKTNELVKRLELTKDKNDLNEISQQLKKLTLNDEMTGSIQEPIENVDFLKELCSKYISYSVFSSDMVTISEAFKVILNELQSANAKHKIGIVGDLGEQQICKFE
jgi:hypothetical protein